MEQFVEPLRSACTLKVKPNSVKQEYEKQDELKRSALRSVAALLQIPKAGMIISKLQLEDISILLFFLIITDKNQHLNDFITLIKNSGDLLPLFESVQRDNTAAAHAMGDGFSMDQS